MDGGINSIKIYCMKKLVFLLSLSLWLFQASVAEAARVDTLMVRSEKMNRSIPVLVTVPDGMQPYSQVPVVYLLHGFSNDEKFWLWFQPRLKQWADRDQVMIVTPDGEESWYWDSPLDPNCQFETFIARELVEYVDSNYPTRANRLSRAITGLSMGGHGGLWLGIRNKDVFGAAGSTSGGVDIRPFPENWEMSKQLGSYKENKKRWDEHTVITQLDKIKNMDLALIFDCGTEDFFYEVNCNLHKELMKRGIYHDFIVRPGGHNYYYWRNSIEYQWLFFKKFFEGYRPTL